MIKHLVRDLALNSEIVTVPIVREESGLAMSSRNVYLTREERIAATALNRALLKAGAAFAEGERSAGRLIEIARLTLESEPLARIDYVELNDAETLQPLERMNGRPALLSLAVFIGNTRLIDNLVLGKAERNAAGANA